LVNLVSGKVIADGCGRNDCLICGPVKAWRIAQAVGYTQPERFVRLSLVGDTWQERRGRIRRWRYFVRQDGYAWQDVFFVERNPKGTGFHAHLYQHGDWVPQAVLQEHAQRSGMGFPDIRRWREVDHGGYAYGLKSATGYGLKGAARSESLTGYLADNGGRLFHASRDFWRSPDGTKLAGWKEAYVNARGSGDRWAFVRSLEDVPRTLEAAWATS
jgi:hypothetical protein